jgi:hypothetical protein
MDTHCNGNNSDAEDRDNLTEGLPLPFCAGPPQREGLIEPTSPRESISEEGNIRNHENIEEDVADCEIDRDTRKVPEKG